MIKMFTVEELQSIDRKSDIFAVFVDRVIEMCKQDGHIGMLQFKKTDVGYACFENDETDETALVITQSNLQFDIKAFY